MNDEPLDAGAVAEIAREVKRRRTGSTATRKPRVRKAADDGETPPEILDAIKASGHLMKSVIDTAWEHSAGVDEETAFRYTNRERAYIRAAMRHVLTYSLAFTFKARERRIALEKRIDALEHKAFNLADSYAGPWRDGETYRRGTLCTYGGSTWIATKNTAARPNDPESGFKLMVKRGRSARDDRSGE